MLRLPRGLMPVPSIDAFLDLVGKSGVVDPARLAGYVEKLRASKTLPADAAKLAGLMVRDAILTQFQAQQLLSGKWKGFFIGKYKVLEKLGSGGMGTVYLAEHKFMKRRVAIKVLPKSRALEPSSLERFYREAKAIAALDHPNIVRAYDIDQDKLPDGSELHFLVMEYVDGSSFQDIIRAKGPLDCTRAAHYIYQAALGLQHAHAVGLVHRDIKPGNLLVDRSGTIKILDMGLARFFNDDEDILTKKYDENVLGTADYLAPEQALDSHNVDIRADIYSLGGTLYFMLTGRSPFGEGTVAQKLIWHQTRRPKPVRELRPDVPEDIVAVLEKMMQKSPAERYQTPQEVAQALAAYAQCASAAPAEAELPSLSPAARAAPSSGVDLQENAGEASSSAATALRKASATVTTAASVPLAPATVTDSAARALADSPSVSKPPAPSGSSLPTEPAPVAASSEGSNGSAKEMGSGLKPPTSTRTPPPTPPPPPPGPPSKPAPRLPAPAPPDEEAVIGGPAPSAEDFSWTAVTDTGEPTARTEDTVKSAVRPVVRRPKNPLPPLPQVSRRLLIIIGSALGGVVLLALVILIATFGNRKPPKSTQPAATTPTAPARTTLFVSKSKVGPDDFGSIQEALEKAEQGDRIVVRDGETYDENLVITPVSGLGKKDIALEAEPDADGDVATLRSSSPEPVIALERVEGFTLKGFRIDGNGASEDLIRISGGCAGTRFEDLRLTGFKRAGIRLDGCEGLRGREVGFRKLHIEANRKDAPQAQAAFAFGPAAMGAAVTPNRHIHISECRITGPYEAAVRLGTPNIGISLDRNLFVANQGPAVLLPADAPPTPSIRTAITRNTFWNCQAGLLLQQRMRLDSELRLTSNLFYHVGAEGAKGGVAVIENDPDPESLSGYVVGEGNVFDPRSQPGNLASVPTFKLSKLSFELPTRDRQAEDFLRYPADSPLATAGEKGGPVGALAPLP